MTRAERPPLVIRLDPDGRHTALEDGELEIRTTGADPHLLARIEGDYDAERQHVLSFEYASTTGTPPLRVLFGPPFLEQRGVDADGLSASEGWISYAVDLRSADWREGYTALCIHLGGLPDRTVRIRNPALRPATAREREIAATLEANRLRDERLEERLRAYLAADFPCRVTEVAVEEDTVVVRGDLAGEGGELHLVESPVYQHVTELSHFDFSARLDGDRGAFEVRLDRYRPLPGRRYDRLFSRWAVARGSEAGWELLSHTRYPDKIHSRWDLPEQRPRGRKGLGGFRFEPGHPDDLDALGIHSVTVNIWLTNLMRAEPGDDTMPFEFDGKSCHVDRAEVEALDRTLRYTAERDIVVLAIVLVRQGEHIPDPALREAFTHPDCHPSAQYSMANLTSPEGLELYAAALDFLAARYSRPDKQHGRIHHWILHNEVDAGWVWTNCGEKPTAVYLDLYHKSLRTGHAIARKYNPHAQAFVSLTHYWNWTADRRFYLPREQLDLLLDFSRAEGDFDWAIAHHPYPESLLEPRTWQDTKVAFRYDTPLITFKNIEVIDAWVRQPRTFFQGARQRRLHLTEQGLNSPDYGEESLLNQAAGMAYAWKKIAPLTSIEAFQYHNWIDDRGEFGLRIGLRRFPDDEQAPGAPKPIWHLYRQLDTPGEDEACAFALERIGIEDWSEIRYAGDIEDD